MNNIDRHILGIAQCVIKNREIVFKGNIPIEDVIPICSGKEESFTENSFDEQIQVEKRITVDIAKADEEQQTVTGIVLQPEVVDGQGDIMSEKVIRDTAYRFLSGFNRTTKLGVQHNTFPKGKLALVESWIAPLNMTIGLKTVKQGSWIMTVKVIDKKLWKKVKDGQITGFSVGGKAKVTYLKE